MKIVIDISKLIYEHAKEQSEDSNDEWDAMRAIANGTPLPEHHGRLIDADELEECKEIMTTLRGESEYAIRMDDIRNMSTIIEADKEDEE